ncbi:unnamed protein product [Lepeophtheirus salmonis]|uniref:(salmon louse) hypothetical protein n=1 Tax=Lepeophtheirus salmonis TaxID=72036 RepID=A0A7R8CPB0_LEPSM|nr:unnamed protein product [Lepeophtheirus salmonis]CAF2883826.1 unnamed protein product [Lepeophtheirus salmonis]
MREDSINLDPLTMVLSFISIINIIQTDPCFQPQPILLRIQGAMPQTTMSSSSTSGINSHSTSNNPPSQPSNLLNPLSGGGGITTGGPSDQFGHCPKAREGPALGCNFCWNTTDINGRILRRKTKYHCPECQANLCIVPCFQSYHEALEKEDRQSQT